MQGSGCHIVLLWFWIQTLSDKELSDFTSGCQGRGDNNSNYNNVMTHTAGDGTLKKHIIAINHAYLQAFPCINTVHTLFKQQDFVLSRCICFQFSLVHWIVCPL